jgi:uncharacterized 2Fe-2S/4Fe-4S cluster protein (DUF4445 family)
VPLPLRKELALPRVVFVPSGASGEFAFKTDLLTAARALGVFVRTSCIGEGRCGECLVVIERGMENLTPIREDELGHVPRRGVRLACRAKVKGDVVVRTLEEPPPAPDAGRAGDAGPTGPRGRST